ncbi:MAG TPA: cobalamin-binding protein [Candidatus Dormibacteraeota bacterium]|nr:cobalamin-binding protein [Candidatus Dormibacteraeota bacterium]
MRIVSLLPSSTEICFALGLGQSLVGVTHECDFPPQAAYKTVMTRNLLQLEGMTPSQIDRHVRAALHEGSSLYALDQAALRRARPDVILTQELCEVCAVGYRQVLDAARLLPGRPTVLSLEPNTLADVLRSFGDVGQVTGARERAAELVRGLWARLDAVRGAVAGKERPRVVCLEWLDPLMVAGHWVPDQVDAAGGIDVLGEPGARSRVISPEEVIAAQPQVILSMPCGYRLEESAAQVQKLAAITGWAKLPAMRSGQVYAVDGSWYFNRPGPRVVDGIEMLARILHPEAWRGPVPQGFLKMVEADPEPA